MKRQRSIDEESGSFKAEAAGSKPAMNREKNELVKEEGRWEETFSRVPESSRGVCGTTSVAFENVGGFFTVG